MRPDPERRIGLHRGDGGSEWGLSSVAKAHFETAFSYPFLIGVGLISHPRAALRHLLKEGFKPSYHAIFENYAKRSTYWHPGR